jgi:hypothetical protein
MIRVASIGYNTRPDFDVIAPEQPSMSEQIIYALKYKQDVRDAAIREGIDVDRIQQPPNKLWENKRSNRRRLKTKM